MGFLDTAAVSHLELVESVDCNADRRNHASPNSAQTEAAAAGALGVQLAGDAYYFGKLYKKPTIGDPLRPVEYEDIRRVNRLMYAAVWLALLIAAAIAAALEFGQFFF